MNLDSEQIMKLFLSFHLFIAMTSQPNRLFLGSAAAMDLPPLRWSTVPRHQHSLQHQIRMNPPQEIVPNIMQHFLLLMFDTDDSDQLLG